MGSQHEPLMARTIDLSLRAEAVALERLADELERRGLTCLADASPNTQREILALVGGLAAES